MSTTKKAATKRAASKKVAPRKVGLKKVAPKKVAPKKVGLKKVGLKKVGLKKVGLKKVAPKKVGLKKVAPKKVGPKTVAPKTAFSTPTQYIAAADEAKRAELSKLHHFIRAALPDHEPCIVHGMIGYGAYHYRYPSGREGDTARVALASNKTGFSVYVSCVDEGGYLAEQAKARLGKASIGKSCIRFKRLADIELDVLGEVLAKARTAMALGDGASTRPAGRPKKRA